MEAQHHQLTHVAGNRRASYTARLKWQQVTRGPWAVFVNVPRDRNKTRLATFDAAICIPACVIPDNAPQRRAFLFDHFIGPQYKPGRDLVTDRLSSPEVNDKFKTCRLLDRNISWLGATENLDKLAAD